MAVTGGATHDRSASSNGEANYCGTNKGETMNLPRRAPKETTFPQQEAIREREEESTKIRRLQVMISMVMSVIGQDPSLTMDEASELEAGAKRATFAMFTAQELA